MGLLSKVFRPQRLSESSGVFNWFWNELMGNKTASGRRVGPDNALQVSAVYACVKVISETMAIFPLKVYRKKPSGGRIEAVNHPLYDVLHRKPNRYQNAFEWIEMIAVHLCLRGNAYCLKVAGINGPFSELLPLRPDLVTLRKDRKTGQFYYEYINDEGNRDTFFPEEILHIKLMPSKDGMTGLSPISLAQESIGIAMAAEEYGASLFGNGAVPKMLLHTDQPLKPDEKRTMEKLWHDNFGGSGNHNKTAVLSHGLTAQNLSISPEEAQFLQTRKYQVADIARIFRVPLHLIGDLERSTNNNIETQSGEFVQYSMLPWVRRLEAAINMALFEDQAGRYYSEFSMDALLRGDSKSRAAFYKEMFNMGVYSINEIREKENENPIGDEGDKRFVNAALVDLKLAGDPNLGKPDVPASPSPDNRTPTQQNSEAKSKARLLILSEIGKMIRWEVAETNKLANNPKEFTGKLELFQIDHGKRMIEKLKPLCELMDSMGEKATENLENAVKTHFSESFTAILEATECPADKLAESVAGVTEKWDKRAGELLALLAI